jgi:predicted ATP-grasp superfamily ATP-dependent carboligase
MCADVNQTALKADEGSPGDAPEAQGNETGSGAGAERPSRLGQCDALVTQGWGRVAYNIVRSLGRRKLKVVLGTDEFLGMAILSRYTAATFRHPSFARQPREFIASLRHSLETYGPRVYIPSDQEVLVVAAWLDQLGDSGTKIPIAPFDTLRVLHKKDALMQLASSLGIPTPENIVPRNLREVLEFSREYGDPVVIKRLSSSSARGVSYVTQTSLLAGNGNSPAATLPFGEFLVQRYVRGTGYGVSMLFNHGELRAKFTHKRLRDRTPTGGVSTVRMSIENALLEEYAEGLLRHVDFHGVAMVEFKFDEETKQAFLIEVNPRFWGSLALAIHAGVDFPYLLYQMALEGDVAPVLDYRKNVTVRWLLGDALATVRRLGHNGRSASSSRDHFTAEAFDDLDWSDLLPLAGEFLFSARKYLKTRHSIADEVDLSSGRP